MASTSICFINQKGGCGKSSTCYHLAGYFADVGLKTLLIDTDPQGSLSQAFLGSTRVENLLACETIAALFDGARTVPFSSLVAHTEYDGLSLVPANQSLARYNTPEPETTRVLQFALRAFVEHADSYDVVLIDCPPNLYQCSWNALVAADYVVVPVPPEDFGAQGLRVVAQAIANAQRLNPTLQLLGHLVTRHDKRLLVHQAYEQKLRTLYGNSVFSTVIPEASAFKVSLACRQPVTQYSPRSKAAKLICDLGREMFERIGDTNARRHVA